MLETVLTVGGTVLVALISGILSWIAGHRRAATEAQSAIHAGFKILVDELQEESTKLREERVGLLMEITELKTEVHSLKLHILAMEDTLRRHNITVASSFQ